MVFGLIDHIKDYLKFYAIATVIIIVFIFSFYPMEVWAGTFVVTLFPDFLTKQSFWVILAESTWLFIGSFFLATFLLILKIVWEHL